MYSLLDVWNLSGNRTGGPTSGNSIVSANLRTIFYHQHLFLKAKIANFGGWDMPIYYGSQIAEHLHTRLSCCVFDVSHMAIVDLTGSGQKAFLQHTLANNIDKLSKDGQALYSCMLNHEGGIIDDLIVYRMGDNYRLVINAANARTDLEWLDEQANNFNDLKIIPRRADLSNAHNPLVILAVQGPHSSTQLAKLFPELNNALNQLKPFHSTVCACAFGEIMFSRTGYTGEDGFELFLTQGQATALWDALLQAGVLPAGLGARDTLRIEAGYNLYGQDMSLTTKPIDCGLSWTVDLQANRSFVGAQALRSSNQQRALLGLVLLDKGVLRVHQEVITNQGNGTITSGTFSPSLQKSIAFASLPKDTPLKSIVHVKVRDQLLQAQVVKNAFVRLGQPLL